MKSLDDFANNKVGSMLKAKGGRSLMPDPEQSAVLAPLVSVDDHLVEPAHLFAAHMASRWGDLIPRIVETDAGQCWQFEDVLEPMPMGATSIVGRPAEEWTMDPVRFDEMRPGSYDPQCRLADMDQSGIAASLCFPSATFGFAGQRFYTKMRDQNLGLAAMRAYNDWIIEEWVGTDPLRFIPQQVTWLPDPRLAVEEIHRNAERGFRAVAFSENPELLGFPSIYSAFWDPFFAACQETDTVINLHLGSSSQVTIPSSDSPIEVMNALFPLNAMAASVDWVFAKIPVRFPQLRIVFSESSISWVPMVQERLRRIEKQYRASTTSWEGMEETPEEVFRRAFWFTSIEDPFGIENRDIIGVDRIMLEVDYPHADTSWPHTQSVIDDEIGHINETDRQRIAWANACEVYRHPTDAVKAMANGNITEDVG